MGTFGTLIDPSHFVEIPDPGNPGQRIRPPAGTTLKARVHGTNPPSDLTDIITTSGGYWSATYAGIDLIVVSGDNWVSTVGPLLSAEGLVASVTAGVAAGEALTTASQAEQLAQSALQTAQDALTQSGAPADSAVSALISSTSSQTRGSLDARLAAERTTVATTPGAPARVGRHEVAYSTTGTSPTLFEFWYSGGGVLSLAAFWLNENGSPRASATKPVESALKLVGYGPTQSGPILAIENRAGAGSGGRTPVWGINKDGRPLIGASEVVGANVVVINNADSGPPAGTPAGTIVIRRAP